MVATRDSDSGVEMVAARAKIKREEKKRRGENKGRKDQEEEFPAPQPWGRVSVMPRHKKFAKGPGMRTSAKIGIGLIKS
jgi:hypothetical protein